MKQGTNFKVPIYGVKVRVYEGDPGKVAQTLGIECEGGNPEINQCDGAVFNHNNGSFTLVVNPGTPVGRVISHECLHLTDVILDFVGVRWEPASEAHAYLMGFLMDRILKILERDTDNRREKIMNAVTKIAKSRTLEPVGKSKYEK